MITQITNLLKLNRPMYYIVEANKETEAVEHVLFQSETKKEAQEDKLSLEESKGDKYSYHLVECTDTHLNEAIDFLDAKLNTHRRKATEILQYLEHLSSDLVRHTKKDPSQARNNLKDLHEEIRQCATEFDKLKRQYPYYF